MKYSELSKEFGGVFRIRLESIPMAAEAAEVHLRPDGRSPGFLPYREKSVEARYSKFKIKSAHS